MTFGDLIRDIRAALAAPDLTLTPFWHSRVLNLVDELAAAVAREAHLVETLDRVLEEGVERWHTTTNDEPSLHSWLGLTWDEFNAYFKDGAAALASPAEPATEERPTEGLPPDLARVLRDPTITISRDHEIRLADGRTLFEHLEEWRNAPSNTASAHTALAASSMSAGAGQVPADTIEKAQARLDTERSAIFSAAIGMARLALRRGDANAALAMLDDAVEKAEAELRAVLTAVRTPEEKA